MTSQDPPDDESQPQPPTAAQSALSEAVEQTADWAAMWSKDIAGFAKQEADKLSANDYGLDDLVTAPVELMRIWVRNTLQMVDLIPNNLALVSCAGSPTPSTPRKMNVQVSVPVKADVTLLASDVVGRRHRYQIPSSSIEVVPVMPKGAPPPRNIRVELTVNSHRAPNDVYEGVLRSTDGTVEVPFRVAINELGGPMR